MTHAYSSIYLSKAARTIGNMLHNAVIEFGMNGNEFLKQFIDSGIAREIENGNPKYIAGKSGAELFIDIVGLRETNQFPICTYDRSDVYWVGWILTQYQWYSGRSFKDILDTISYDDLIGLYKTLHEADVSKAYDVFDMHFSKNADYCAASPKEKNID